MKIVLENGKIYWVNHSRKGPFVMRVDSQDSDWAHGVVIEGKAGAIHEVNERHEGERVSVRINLLREAVEQPGT